MSTSTIYPVARTLKISLEWTIELRITDMNVVKQL